MNKIEARRIALLREAIKNVDKIKEIQTFIDQELKAMNRKAA
ncbi:hypothetical protein [Escherichia coli]|nr:hypothetical protein [Escherichia coli]EMW63921.1 hypothetical protein EC2749250_4952 [Escherichia coli 2749250]